MNQRNSGLQRKALRPRTSKQWSRSNVAGVVTTLRVGGSRFRVPVRENLFLFSQKFRLSLGPNQPPIRWVQCLFPEGEEAGA